MRVKRTIRKLPKITARLVQTMDNAVAKTTAKIQLDAKAIVPVDTGACRASIYQVTSKGSDYEECVADASTRRPELLDPLRDVALFEKEEESEPLKGYVACGVNYGGIIEQGRALPTPIPPRPFMEPAAVENTQAFSRAIEAAFRQALR